MCFYPEKIRPLQAGCISRAAGPPVRAAGGVAGRLKPLIFSGRSGSATDEIVPYLQRLSNPAAAGAAIP